MNIQLKYMIQTYLYIQSIMMIQFLIILNSHKYIRINNIDMIIKQLTIIFHLLYVRKFKITITSIYSEFKYLASDELISMEKVVQIIKIRLSLALVM
jgi:hypothetical protein